MSATAHNPSLSQKLAYPRALVQAGLAGLRSGEFEADRCGPEFAVASRSALKAAVVAAGIGLLASNVRQNPRRAVRNALTFAGITFCADFCWNSRDVSRRALTAVRKEMSHARDQHWLELNPIDYA